MSCDELFYWVIKLAKRKASFHFPEARKLKRILWILWIFKTNFVNRKNSSHTAHSVICFNNFEEKIAERGKKCKLLRQLHPATAVYNDSKSNLSLFRIPTIPRKSSRKRKIGVDKLVLFQAADELVDTDSISEQNSPKKFIFKRLDNSV